MSEVSSGVWLEWEQVRGGADHNQSLLPTESCVTPVHLMGPGLLRTHLLAYSDKRRTGSLQNALKSMRCKVTMNHVTSAVSDPAVAGLSD